MDEIRYLSILGSTGSVGRQSLDIIGLFPKRFKVIALGAGKNLSLLQAQIKKFQPQLVCVMNKELANRLSLNLPKDRHPKIVYGQDGYEEIATLPKVDMVVSAMVGISGLRPTLAAIEAGKTVILANKESLVAGGALIVGALKRENQILPIDSEHSAIFQLLHNQKRAHLKRIILTASGGPFWNLKKEELSKVTPEMTLKHPNWSMGEKISVDSATLMNKGLEVIEAKWLFDVPLSKIDIAIHPQSIVHSLIELADGTIMAHLGVPDMHLPIAFALNYPERFPINISPLDLFSQPLTFFPPDFERFPCLHLALEAARIGGTMPAVLSAADEVAIKAFLNGKIEFTDIPKLIASVMERHETVASISLETILAVDKWARDEAEKWIRRHMGV